MSVPLALLAPTAHRTSSALVAAPSPPASGPASRWRHAQARLLCAKI